MLTDRITARLSTTPTPPVVLAAIKVVMKCMECIDNSETVRALCKKLNPPLVTLLSDEPEVQFVALRNIGLRFTAILETTDQVSGNKTNLARLNLTIRQADCAERPGILANDVKMFFCKYNDPVYVKLEKVVSGFCFVLTSNETVLVRALLCVRGKVRVG